MRVAGDTDVVLDSVSSDVKWRGWPNLKILSKVSSNFKNIFFSLVLDLRTLKIYAELCSEILINTEIAS